MKNVRNFAIAFMMAISMMPSSAMEKESPYPGKSLLAKQIEAFLMCDGRLQEEGIPRDVKNLIFANLIHLSGNIDIHTRNLQIDSSTTDKGLLLVVRRSPFAKILDLSFCDVITGEGMANAGQELYFLNALNLTGCDHITGSHLLALIKECSSNLSSLNISGCRKVSGAKFQLAMDQCPKITSMNLPTCPKISDKVILNIVKKRPHFISIGLGCSKDGRSSAIVDIVKSSSKHTSFSLLICKDMDGHKLLTILQNIPTLVSLTVSGCIPLSNLQLLTLLELCPLLTELRCPYADSVFQEIRPQIKKNYPNLIIWEDSFYQKRPLYIFLSSV